MLPTWRQTVPIVLGLFVAAAPLADAGRSRPEIAPGYERSPYLQSLGENSVVVAWIASARGTPWVDYGTTPAYGQTVEAERDGARRHVKLTGLYPGTTYFYRVRAGDRVLAEGGEYRFRTDEGPTDREFSFFVTGDIGTKKGKQVLTSASILRADPRPELGILCGDIVYTKGRSSDYDERLMYPWRDLFSNITVWPALGNHDWESSPKKNWEHEWHLPNNEHYYSFDYGNAHFVALDTQDGKIYDRKRQVRWLEDDLARHSAAGWTFVYFHHPGITCTYKHNNDAVIDHFLPVLDRFDVDVAFSGHAHAYERLYPITSGRIVDREQDPDYVDPEGTIYIVSGAGGKVKDNKPTRRCGPNAFFLDETILWTHVAVSGATCTIRTYASQDDRLVDEVTITKSHLERLASP
jgi:hypothetical protein